jgi:hypothetical protein
MNGTAADFWATSRQLAQLELLVEHLGPEQAAPVLRQFCGGSHLADAARFMTRREAASLVLLLTVVTSQQPLVA